MIDEASYHREIVHGHAARAELNLVGEIIAKTRAALVEEIIAAKADDELNTQRKIVTCQVLDKLKAALQQAVGAGEAAATILHNLK